MGRIMQVIDKRSNFTSGTVDLKLYQTNFVGLTKVITDVPGQTVLNATEGQNVGYQFFHDLCLKQLDTRNYVDRFKPVYNAEIDKKKPTVNNLLPFSYNWKSCVDYRSQIVSGDKADYRLFQKVVNAEKELYDYRLYVSDHVKRNCDIMAVWGAGRKYGSNVEMLSTFSYELSGGSDGNFSIVKNDKNLRIDLIKLGPEKFRLNIYELQKIGVGEQALIDVNSRQGVFKFGITRHPLGTTQDDGYFTKVEVIQNPASQYEAETYRLFNIKSPHFKKDGVYDLEFFRTRKLI